MSRRSGGVAGRTGCGIAVVVRTLDSVPTGCGGIVAAIRTMNSVAAGSRAAMGCCRATAGLAAVGAGSRRSGLLPVAAGRLEARLLQAAAVSRLLRGSSEGRVDGTGADTGDRRGRSRIARRRRAEIERAKPPPQETEMVGTSYDAVNSFCVLRLLP